MIRQKVCLAFVHSHHHREWTCNNFFSRIFYVFIQRINDNDDCYIFLCGGWMGIIDEIWCCLEMEEWKIDDKSQRSIKHVNGSVPYLLFHSKKTVITWQLSAPFLLLQSISLNFLQAWAMNPSDFRTCQTFLFALTPRWWREKKRKRKSVSEEEEIN